MQRVSKRIRLYSKVDDIKKLGAKEAIVTNEKDWAKPWAFAFDFILNCSDLTHTFDLQTYMSTLRVGGKFHMVGLLLPEMMAQGFAGNAAKLTGTLSCGEHSGVPTNADNASRGDE